MAERAKRMDSLSQIIALCQQLSLEDQSVLFATLVSKMEADSDSQPELLPPPFLVTRTHLEQTLALTLKDTSQLTDEDLTEISRRMHSHYVNDLFWEELAFHTVELIDEKNDSLSTK